MVKYNRVFILISFYFFYFMTGCNIGSGSTSVVSNSLRNQCIQKLKDVMNTQSQFVKVHAAEYLLWSGHPDHVKETFMHEGEHFDTVAPYRIGIWRVLTQADSNSKKKKIWIENILQVFKDTNATDRVDAAETLGKLHISPAFVNPNVTENAIESTDISLSLCTLWAASITSSDSEIACRNKLLNIITSSGQEDTLQRKVAAYILRHVGGLNAKEWELVSIRALSELVNSEAKAYLLSAAFIMAPKDSLKSKMYAEIKKDLLKEKDSPTTGNRTEMAAALSKMGTKEDLPVLISLLNNKNPLGIAKDDADVESAAAYAILKIGSRYD